MSGLCEDCRHWSAGEAQYESVPEVRRGYGECELLTYTYRDHIRGEKGRDADPAALATAYCAGEGGYVSAEFFTAGTFGCIQWQAIDTSDDEEDPIEETCP